MTDVADIDRRQTRLFAFLSIAAAIGLLMGLAFGALLLKGQGDHERDRRAADDREVQRQADEDARAVTQAALLGEVKAATAAAKDALDTIKDCTTAGGECYRRGQARTAEAVNEIVRRLNATATQNATLLARNADLQRQVVALVAEVAALRSAVVAANPPAPGAPPPVNASPGLCSVLPLAALGCP